MINELEQLQNFQDDLGSRDASDRLGALQSMQGQDPGLMGLPVVQEPVGDPRAMLQPEGDPRAMLQNIPLEAPPINPMLGAPQGPVNPMLGAAYGGPIIQRKGGGMAENVQIIGDTAEGLASFGRHGDNMLLHINPEELAGLASLGEITYNPITGLPEAWGIKSFFKPFKQAAKAVKKVTKSKAFRQLAPLALTIAAPYLAGYALAPAGMSTSAYVAGMSPWAMGLSTAAGAGLGALAGGAKTSDAWKAAALSGLSAGALRGYTNYQDYGSMWGPQTPTNIPTQGAQVYDPTIRTTFSKPPSSYTTPIDANKFNLGQPSYLDTSLRYAPPPEFGVVGGDPSIYGGAIPSPNITGVSPIEMDPNLLRTDIRSGYYGQSPRTIDIASRGGIPPQPSYVDARFNQPYLPAKDPLPLSPDIASSQYTGSSRLPMADAGVGAQSDYIVGSRYTPQYTQPQPSWMDRQIADLKDTRLGRGISDVGEYITDPESITGGIIEDYGTGRGLLKLAAIDALTPDYTGEREHERTLNEAREELERQEWEFKRVLTPEETGFGQTYVVVDPSGVEYNLTEAEILDIAYGRRARPKLTPSIRFNPERFVPTKHGGGLGSLIHRQGSGSANPNAHLRNLEARTPDVVGDIRDSLENEFINDLRSMTPEEFETKYNMTMQEGHNQLKVMFPEVKPGDWNELFSGRALQPIPKQPLPDLPPERRTPIGTFPPVIPRARGGEFRGQVSGNGHGMEDNVYMPIKDKGKQVGTLAVSPSEYVVDSYTMSALGNGNPDAGAKVMDGVVESVRKKAYGTVRQPNEIDGLQALRPMIERV
jgi:hypothetical protein